MQAQRGRGRARGERGLQPQAMAQAKEQEQLNDEEAEFQNTLISFQFSTMAIQAI
jgi:hypothetical protein